MKDEGRKNKGDCKLQNANFKFVICILQFAIINPYAKGTNHAKPLTIFLFSQCAWSG
jgi:hypothetical protein